MSYSFQPRNRISVKGCRFLSFPNSIDTNVDENISKNLTGKYSKKFLDHAKQSATDAHKTSSKRSM